MNEILGYLSLPTASGEILIKYDSIISVRSHRGYVTIDTQDGKEHTVSLSMDDFIERFEHIRSLL